MIQLCDNKSSLSLTQVSPLPRNITAIDIRRWQDYCIIHFAHFLGNHLRLMFQLTIIAIISIHSMNRSSL